MRQIQRRGMSLLEMMVVVATSSVVLGASTTILVASLRASRDAGGQVVRRRAWTEFERQLRIDAHGATEAKRDGDAFVLARRDGEVRYAQVGPAIERREQGETPRRELYRLGTPYMAQWTISSESPAFLTLRFATDPDDPRAEQAWKAISVVVEVGKDARLAKALGEVTP